MQSRARLRFHQSLRQRRAQITSSSAAFASSPCGPQDEGGAAPNPEDDSKFDEFLGNDAGALAGTGEYDEDDKEADEIWEAVDTFMDERRRVSGLGVYVHLARACLICMVGRADEGLAGLEASSRQGRRVVLPSLTPRTPWALGLCGVLTALYVLSQPKPAH